MLVRNTTAGQIEVYLDGLPGHPPKHLLIEAGDVADFPDGYCQGVPGAGGRVMKPIVERTWPGLKVLPPSKQDRAKRAALAAAGGKTTDVPAVEVMMAKFELMADRMAQLEAGNKAKDDERDQLAAQVAELQAKLAEAEPQAKVKAK